MTNEERVLRVHEWSGLTPRQAGFLTSVLLHSGVCVQRQYDQFAGIANGRATRDFFEELVRRRLATAYPCVRGNARIYHVHNRSLYALIGEPHSRFRKRANVARALERLMVLDAVLAAPGLRWLATEREKVEHFVKRHSIDLSELPSVAFGSEAERVTRFFAEKMPIGVGTLGEITLMYLVGEPTGREFRSFLERYRQLLKRLPRWRVQLVANHRMKAGLGTHRRAIEDFCAPPLPPRIGDEFGWYCRSRRALERGAGELANDADKARYVRARRAFSAPRFYAAYRRWLRDGDSSLLDLLTTHFHDAWRRDGGIVDTVILRHAYAHLIPLACTA